jgi:hypothetical protein
MIERNPQPTEALQDIKQLMQRSSRFISLSGLSGIAAGVCALAGALMASTMLGGMQERTNYSGNFRLSATEDAVTLKLLGLAAGTFLLAFISAFYLTWRKAKMDNLPVWDYTSRRLLWNVMVPMIAGGFFIIGMLQYGEWRFVAPACLIFYGLALINGSKYTLSDIRYLGYLEIVLGVISMWFIGYGLLFWAIGFGVLHIIYGAIMWFKYERNPEIN